jgi:hypothetical protein
VQMDFEEKDKIVQARETWHQLFRAQAGEIRTSIGRV